MANYVHRLSDPRDPAYPFSDTFVCSKCNERLSLDATTCDICNLYIYGEVDSSSYTPSTYPEHLDIPNANLRVAGAGQFSSINVGSARIFASYDLDVVTAKGNTTPQTVQFTNPTKGFDVT